MFKGARIATRSPMPVQGDGDLIGKTPFEFTVARVGDRGGAEEAATAERVRARRAAVAAPVPGADLRKTLLQELAAFDSVGYLWVNRLHDCPPASYIARLASRAMDHGRIWVAIAALFTVFDRRFGWKGFVLVVAPLWLAELTVNYPLKSLFSRRRPFVRYETSRVLARNRPLIFVSLAQRKRDGGAVLTPWAPGSRRCSSRSLQQCASRVYPACFRGRRARRVRGDQLAIAFSACWPAAGVMTAGAACPRPTASQLHAMRIDQPCAPCSKTGTGGRRWR